MINVKAGSATSRRSQKISLGRSYGHPGRTTGDPHHHPDGEAYGDQRNVETVPEKVSHRSDGASGRLSD